MNNNFEFKEKRWRIPYGDKILRVIKSFSVTEKAVFYFLVFVFGISALVLLYQVNKLFLVAVPDYGGTLTEGVIGSPRFINPILASSDTDKDLSTLIYSGLLRVDPSGQLIPDLAETYNISEDGLTYTATLKNATFHDGIKVTADDVVFTVERAQDPSLKSPREANWQGVKVTKVDDKTVRFTLSQAYSPFIENLTTGILPKHIWSKATNEEFPFSQYNTKPIGSGPYKVDYITYNGSGLPSEYHLKAFNKYALGEPYITNLVIKSYPDMENLISNFKDGNVESIHGVTPKELPNLKIDNEIVLLSPLPRIFGVFFNQNVAPVLVNKEVRLALNKATDKQEIINSVLQGYGEPIDSPIPPQNLGNKATSSEDRVTLAEAILTRAGWKQNDSGIFEKKDKKGNTTTLSFSISTGDAPELKAAAYLLQKQWEKIGALVEVKIFELGDLNQNIIRNRKYDSLLFGEVVGRDLDLYPFWHSSERVSPGLNIALYTNLRADKMLENFRKTNDPDLQKDNLSGINNEITNDVPAVFTYAPYFIYIVPNKVHGVELGTLTTANERFGNVYKWYIETNNVWKFFAKQNNN